MPDEPQTIYNDKGEEMVFDVRGKRVTPTMLSIGRNYYGRGFKGFNRIDEIRDLLPSFKAYYYECKIKDKDALLNQIMKGFNKDLCEPMNRVFHPLPESLRQWRKKWDADILATHYNMRVETDKNAAIAKDAQIIKTREADGYVTPSDHELEAGVRTLGGELLNDALMMLRNDQNMDEAYSDDIAVKRRNYVVNVFSTVTRMAQGKASLLLKASEEKRNNAGFLMGLLAKAQSGKLSDDEMSALKTTYTTPPNGSI